MGQTLSYDAGTRTLHLTTDMPGDLVSQVLLQSSGLAPRHITPAAGWTVLPGPVLRFRPAAGDPMRATFNSTPIATLTKAPSANARAAFTPLADADAVDAAEPWITRPIETVSLGYTVLAQPYVSVAQGCATLIGVAASRRNNATVWTVSPDTASVIDGHLVATHALGVGSTTFSVTGTAGALTDTAEITVEVVAGTSVAPGDTLSAVQGGDAPLAEDLFDFDGNTVTNVTLVPTATVGVATPDGEVHTSGEVVVPRADFGGCAICGTTAGARGGARSDEVLSTDCIDYYASIDGGLSYVHTGQLCLNTIPCFEASARVRVGPKQWKRADKLRSGDRVLDASNRWQRVTRVAVSRPARVATVTVRRGHMGALRDVTFSRTHRVRMPNGRVAPAMFVPNARHAVAKTRLCHVETRTYCMLVVEGVVAESWARTRAQRERRAMIDDTRIGRSTGHLLRRHHHAPQPKPKPSNPKPNKPRVFVLRNYLGRRR